MTGGRGILLSLVLGLANRGKSVRDETTARDRFPFNSVPIVERLWSQADGCGIEQTAISENKSCRRNCRAVRSSALPSSRSLYLRSESIHRGGEVVNAIGFDENGCIADSITLPKIRSETLARKHIQSSIADRDPRSRK
jgi:hypothetical protein